MSVGRLVDEAVNASIVLVGRVLVGLGCWRSERRRDAVAGRAQRFLDAERLAEDEAEIDVWEPCSNQGSLDAIDALKGAMWCKQHRTTKQFCSERSHDPDAVDGLEVWGDGCTCFITPERTWFRYGSAVEPGSQVEPNPDCKKHFPEGPESLWEPDGPSAFIPPEGRDAAAETGGLDICTVHTSAFPAGGRCRACFPVGVSSAGAGGGPEAVSGQPPASGQPTATELLDHINALVKAHYITGIGGYGVVCCCGHEGALSLDHAAHVADLILALVPADVRVGDALKGTRL